MKKLFFFRSSSSSSNNNQPSPKDEEVYWETPPGKGFNNQRSGEKIPQSPRGLFSRSHKQAPETQSTADSQGLRRTRSLSSAAFDGGEMGQINFSGTSDHSGSPSHSVSGMPARRSTSSSRRHACIPEKQLKKQYFEVDSGQGYETERTSSAGSLCSSSVSNKIVDRFIDGEEQQERSKLKNLSQTNHTGKANGQSRRPPRFQYTAPTSPADSIKDKPKCHSFREVRGVPLIFSTREWSESGVGHESPRILAKNVIEKLSQCHALPQPNRKSFESDIPITIEDIYARSLNRSSSSTSGELGDKSSKVIETYEAANQFYGDDTSSLQEENHFASDNSGGWDTCEVKEVPELHRKWKEAEERVMLLSQEFEQGSYLHDGEIELSALIRKIRNLVDEKISLAIEVSDLLKCRLADQASAKEDKRLVREELHSQTRKLERERNEIQSRLEKELDRRSSDWSYKLEKYQSEEQRLRDRVRDLAEQNVSLQREVSSFSERDTENRSMMTHSEQQLKHLTSRVEEASKENQELKHTLADLQDKYRGAEEDRDCLRKHYEEKDKECQELHKSITRLLRTCNEQDKTIGSLREDLSEKIEKSSEKVDRHVKKMQLEELRLTGVEQALRREVESYRAEVDSLRRENIDLLNRLKGYMKEGSFSTVKLDQELRSHIFFLQDQGLKMLKESLLLCSKLQDLVKVKTGLTTEAQQDVNSVKHGLDRQFVIECDMKIHGLKRGIESLVRSLQTMSALHHEKANLIDCNSQSSYAEYSLKMTASEDILKSELKAEILLTRLLREKMYFKEQEVEQLQAELATAVRGNDILKSEVQNALDELSSATHKLKDLEIQMLRKDESVSNIRDNLQQSSKELAIMRGILPKVTEERDVMWEEVKQYSEKNMLLNSEVNMLKKKIEALDEDILMKEGQISILKDTISRKPTDLFGSPISSREFLLQ